MKGFCKDVICQICNQEMSFGRIKRHIKSRHKSISIENYFHNIEQNKINDIFKTQLAKEKGFKLIRIWESEIKVNPNIILERLNECI